MKTIDTMNTKSQSDREIEELNFIWKDIDDGKGFAQSRDEFLNEMNE